VESCHKKILLLLTVVANKKREKSKRNQPNADHSHLQSRRQQNPIPNPQLDFFSFQELKLLAQREFHLAAAALTVERNSLAKR